MSEASQTPPVLFIVFKRPDTTKRVFQEIRRAKPRQLFIGADGPRANNSGDEAGVNEVRSIVQNVDWECEVKTLFHKTNVGSKIAESSAINYFFDHVDEGIILEDDCLPNQSFFRFCEELLQKHRNDRRIMHISGNNFQFGRTIGTGDYYYSNLTYSWGWATWKRAWIHYDAAMSSYPEFKLQNHIENIFSSKRIRSHLMEVFDSVYSGKVDCWDYQWLYAILSEGGLCVCPNVNLVSNIGYGPDGTNCTDINTVISNVEAKSLAKIIHPAFTLPSKDADLYAFKKCNPYPMCLVRFQKYIKPEYLRRMKILWNLAHFGR